MHESSRTNLEWKVFPLVRIRVRIMIRVWVWVWIRVWVWVWVRGLGQLQQLICDSHRLHLSLVVAILSTAHVLPENDVLGFKDLRSGKDRSNPRFFSGFTQAETATWTSE